MMTAKASFVRNANYIVKTLKTS